MSYSQANKRGSFKVIIKHHRRLSARSGGGNEAEGSVRRSTVRSGGTSLTDFMLAILTSDDPVLVCRSWIQTQKGAFVFVIYIHHLLLALKKVKHREETGFC